MGFLNKLEDYARVGFALLEYTIGGPSQQDKNHHLQAAVLGGLNAFAKFSLAQGADPNANFDSSPGKLELPLLVIAVDKKHNAIARMMVDRGADVNARDLYGDTALTKAIGNKDEGMVHFLLDRGANPQLSSTPSSTQSGTAFGNGSILTSMNAAAVRQEKLALPAPTLTSTSANPTP